MQNRIIIVTIITVVFFGIFVGIPTITQSSCGKLFAQLEPRIAIAYHTFNDFNTAPDIIDGIRQSYGGPLTLADDLLVWNVTTDGILTRRVIGTDETLPAAPPQPAGPPDPSERTELSDWLEAGRVDLLN